MQDLFRANNFDLIRLIAALQVAIRHSMRHLDVGHESSMLYSILSYFPGVPIFFFVSGFLISKSYENNPLLREYTQNRVLRLFPALILCTLFALFSVYLTGYLEGKNYSLGEFIFWVTGQVSFYQFYNPEFMREFGTGVLNGSLWTISVELQFYILVPILYWMLGLFKADNANWKLLTLISVFMAFHVGKFALNQEYDENVLFKLFGVSFFPWIWMFLVGVFFQKNFGFLYGALAGKVLYVLPAYLLLAFLAKTYFGWNTGNGINPILFLALSILVFSFAYSLPMFSQKILNGNDVSYGVYIYHIPVVNILIYYGYTSEAINVVAAIAISIVLAGLSWFILEKNCMKLKRHPLNPLNKAYKESHSFNYLPNILEKSAKKR